MVMGFVFDNSFKVGQFKSSSLLLNQDVNYVPQCNVANVHFMWTNEQKVSFLSPTNVMNTTTIDIYNLIPKKRLYISSWISVRRLTQLISHIS